ncbi:MAG: single-stranded DNA-binding protein [Spirochaetia bacterium]|nr:single-stranded DNA-binding protein [Spirochaetia bacterium]
MANDLNQVMLIGRLTRDPELKQVGSGTSLCRFSIANNRNYTQNGERKEEVSFFNCVAWGKQAEIITRYCSKGKQVAIEGRLKQNTWEDKDGKKQSTVDVVVNQLQMLGPSSEGGGSGGGSFGGSESSSYQDPGPSREQYPDMMEEDDVPF